MSCLEEILKFYGKEEKVGYFLLPDHSRLLLGGAATSFLYS